MRVETRIQKLAKTQKKRKDRILIWLANLTEELMKPEPYQHIQTAT